MSDDQRFDEAGGEHDAHIERREILARFGKLAALTPPAVLALLTAPRASAGSIP